MKDLHFGATSKTLDCKILFLFQIFRSVNPHFFGVIAIGCIEVEGAERASPQKHRVRARAQKLSVPAETTIED
jgi:hypothetical protein